MKIAKCDLENDGLKKAQTFGYDSTSKYIAIF